MKVKLYIAVGVCVLIMAISGFLIYQWTRSDKIEPLKTYEMPERTGNVSVNDGRLPYSRVTALPKPNMSAPSERKAEEVNTSQVVESVTEFDDKGKVIEQHDHSNSEVETTDSNGVSDEELQRQLDSMAEIQPEFESAIAEGEAVINQYWDETAKELRPKSIAERQSFLSEMRIGLSEDEEPEWVDWYIDNLVKAMSDRGVHFE